MPLAFRNALRRLSIVRLSCNGPTVALESRSGSPKLAGGSRAESRNHHGVAFAAIQTKSTARAYVSVYSTRREINVTETQGDCMNLRVTVWENAESIQVF